MKKFFKIFFIIFFVLLMSIIIFGVVFYNITYKNSKNYIPENSTIFGEIKSSTNLLDSLFNLRALDLAFSIDEINKFSDIYQEIKTNPYLNNFISKHLINIGVDFFVLDDSSLVILDLGYRTIFLNYFIPFFNQIENSGIELVRTDKKAIIEYDLFYKEKFIFKLVKKNNLIFISTKIEPINKALYSDINGENIYLNRDIKYLEKKSDKNSLIDIYIKTDDFIKKFNDKNKYVKNILNFKNWTLINLTMDNFKIKTKAYIEIESKNSYLDKIKNFKTGEFESINIFPYNTISFASLKFDSFEDIINIALQANGMNSEKILSEVYSASKFLFGLDKDRLFYDWIDKEVGMFLLDSVETPLFFGKVKDVSAWNYAVKKIGDSAVMNAASNIIVDDVRISKIFISDVFKPITRLFFDNFDTIYFIEDESYLFFSLEPEPLAEIKKYINQEKKLINNIEFKAEIKNLNLNSNICFYYDLTKNLPKNLIQDRDFLKLIQLYKTMLSSIQIFENEVQVELMMLGKNEFKEVKVPGYPKKFENKIKSDIFWTSLNGGKSHQLFYIDEKNNLILNDSSGQQYEFTLTDNGFIKYDEKYIYLFLNSGIVHKFDFRLREVEPFPIDVQDKINFGPATYKDKFILFLKKEKFLFFFTKSGEIEKINFDFAGNILYTPTVIENFLAVYPKKLTNQIYLIDLNSGEIINNWPVVVGGPSFNSPIYYESLGEKNILFLTQSGTLHCFDFYGNQTPGFPVELNSVFYESIKILKSKKDKINYICVLDKNGKLSLIDDFGVIKKTLDLFNIEGRNSKILTVDINFDGEDELFIYGDFDYIFGFDSDLNELKNFPVEGLGKPIFKDLDFNGDLEMIVKKDSNSINAYFIRGKK